ncbi:ADP-ribosylation/crystallin J1 [Calothrix parasitica NIES-267]|uniref:ADP-ribosylation/crystallin J1 n=1 Tax=Calothrix parasitica NIES-267 TaxID=1973488 RepID=A0A1Z4LN24_9CYAN|nr:ADP-ribosylation/crystallin J1 [Calothrix parasitica NIES-267]
MSNSNNIRLNRAFNSLQGLSVGDAFGEKFFLHPDVAENIIASRAIPALPWYYTDDTQMSLSIYWVLREYGEINQDELAKSFARRYDEERGYGAGMQRLLLSIRDGEKWQYLSSSSFAGQGSYGNGGAMRVAPLGAFFADDMDLVVKQAVKSAEVTHAHSEGIAGTVAVAVAAAFACNLKESNKLNKPNKTEFLDLILPYIPESEVASKVRRARDLQDGISVNSAAAILGNGTKVSAQDTVPFALWCAAQNLDNYQEALWLTVSGLGDRDTTCAIRFSVALWAIAGGIVSLYAGVESIPNTWLQAREVLPKWINLNKQELKRETVTLYRPVGEKELVLIKESGCKQFPPRLPEQPIFYPVLNQEYAIEIARD